MTITINRTKPQNPANIFSPCRVPPLYLALLFFASPLLAQDKSKSDTTIGSTQLLLDQHDTQIAQFQNGRPTIPGIPNFLNGVKFNGVSVTTGSFSSVFASSESINFMAADSAGFTNTTAGTSISTLTITASGNYHICTGGSVVITNSGAGATQISLLINGLFPDASFGGTKSLWGSDNGAASYDNHISLSWRSNAIQAAGTINASLSPFVSSGTGTIRGQSGNKLYTATWWLTECP